MCAAFAPPKLPLTSWKAGQDAADTAVRRRIHSSSGRNRSPSPLSREFLNGGKHEFGEDDATLLSTTRSLIGGSGGSSGSGGGNGNGGYSTGEGPPSPIAISQALKARGYSPNGGGDSTKVSATSPLVSLASDEKPTGARLPYVTASSAACATKTATAAGTGTAGAYPASDTVGAGASQPNAAAAIRAIPTFAEIARGVIDRHGALPLEPFANARVRAAEEGWTRREADREEREKQWLLRMLLSMTFLLLVAVLFCRWIGVGIAISGPAGTVSRGGQPLRNGGPNENASVLGLFSTAVGEMPVIVSSRDELAAVLKIAGIRKPKPAQVNRAWTALASGESRKPQAGDALGMRYHFAGGALVAKVLIAMVLRNPAFAVLCAATLGTLVSAAFFRGTPLRWRNRAGTRTGGAGREAGGGATNGSSITVRGGGRLRVRESRGRDGGCGINGTENGRGGGRRWGAKMRSPSPSSRRRLASG